MATVSNLTLTANPPLREEIINPCCMNRFVRWFANETSTVFKIGVLIFAILPLIGIGFLIGQPIFVPLIGATALACVLACFSEREWVVDGPSEELQERAQHTAAFFEKMKEAVGGAAEFDRLETLPLGSSSFVRPVESDADEEVD